MTQKTNSYNGLGFLSILTLIFITLKLTGYISWSWWAVLAPLWIPWGFVLLVFLFVASFGVGTKHK